MNYLRSLVLAQSPTEVIARSLLCNDQRLVNAAAAVLAAFDPYGDTLTVNLI
jgi:hypothetical protein